MAATQPKAHRAAVPGIALVIGLVSGLIAVASVDAAGPLAAWPFREVTQLPPMLYLVVAVGSVSLIVSQRVWWFGLAMFFIWLPLEDLIRKFQGNDIRIYFFKFMLLVVAVAGIARFLRGRWRPTLGSAWWPTIAVVAFAFIWSIPSAVQNPYVPLVGVVVRYGYLVLLPIGAYLAADFERLRRTFVLMAVFGSAVCAIGIAQTILGPQFLNPSSAAQGLENSIVVRVLGEATVVRPSGPFVDAGRFASMCTVTLVVGLCLFRMSRSAREAAWALVASTVALAAAYASGSRATLAVCVVIAVFGFFVAGSGNRLRNFGFLVLVVGVLFLGANTTGKIQDLTSNRTSYYLQSFDPTAEDSEARYRLRTYIDNFRQGVAAGGLLGDGTGTQSVGLQYVPGTKPPLESEGGWGNVATEGGLVGLAIWVAWTAAWLRRSVEAARGSAGLQAGRAMPVIAFFNFLTLIYLFTVSGASLDNYITNIFFWLLSGILFGVDSQRQARKGETANAAHSRVWATSESGNQRAVQLAP